MTDTNTNELARSTSPYLLDHATNPVHWRLWSDEAFEEARQRDVPVLLSIGYSTCYWCHVMARECFESPDIAKLMNERFVCVKLDREEHPEIDELYMAATVTMTGSGGWPMTVFLEPGQRRPFWCGTYLPPEPAHARPSLPDVLRSLSSAWSTQREEVIAQSDRLASAVTEHLSAKREPTPIGPAQVQAAITTILRSFDRTNGGFSGAPKFPQPPMLELLLDARAIVDQPSREAIDHAVRTTLDAMALGGLFDQVSGGFRRYSVDETWTVPHFEKMLYDNAQLLGLYARAAAVYDDHFYAHITKRTAASIIREFTDPAQQPGSRGFYSAIDAEVDAREGAHDLWTKEDLEQALDPDERDQAAKLYGLDSPPNFQDPHHPEAHPAHVLRLGARPDTQTIERLESINAKLLAHRLERPQPHTDTKVLAEWNALTISALARASRALGDPELMHTARRALAFVTDELRTPTGALGRAWKDGTCAIEAQLADHAALLSALVELRQDDPPLDDRITELLHTINERFATEPGVYHDTAENRSDLFTRPRTTHDSTIPSPSGTMTLALAQLATAHKPGNPFIDPALDALRAVSHALTEHPHGSAASVRALIAMLTSGDTLGDRRPFTDAPAPATRAPRSPVTLFVSDESVELTKDAPAASIKVALDIAEPYHIVSADPGSSDTARAMMPLRVGLISGQGVAVYADYPIGSPHGSEAIGTISAHSGRVEFEIAIERAEGVGPTPGHPVLGITYQACSDTQCAEPRTVKLGVDIVLSD